MATLTFIEQKNHLEFFHIRDYTFNYIAYNQESKKEKNAESFHKKRINLRSIRRVQIIKAKIQADFIAVIKYTIMRTLRSIKTFLLP